MDTVAPRPLAVARAEVLVATLVAMTTCALLVTLAPPGGDSAAHIYRTFLLREGVFSWDNLWFAGHYPFVSYSVLYYLPAAVVGNVPLVTVAVVVSAALFAAIAHDEWGATARWPVRAFAVATTLPLFTGTYSYAAGFAAALGTIRLLQLGRPRWAIACAALTLGFSPLAFALLLVALVAAVLATRIDRQAVFIGGALLGVAAIQVALLALFPSDGRYPYNPESLLGVVSVAAFAAPLALRSEHGRTLGAFFLVWAAINVAAFIIPSPFGDNLARLRYVLFPLVLLAVLLARARPRSLAFAALAAALVYNIAPDVSALPKRVGDARTAQEAYWRPALDFLHERSTPNERVEVVPTFGHWEAWWVPRERFALARGWYRQLDIGENPELYRDPLQPRAYRRWLHRMGVRFVLLPSARLGPLGAKQEAVLLQSGRAGLKVVFESPDWRIYELRGAGGILTGSARARLDRFEHDRIVGHVAAAGTYRLRVRYTPLWGVRSGSVCMTPAADGMTRLRASRAGRFELHATESAGGVVRAALEHDDVRC
jgi:hypothetical protein